MLTKINAANWKEEVKGDEESSLSKIDDSISEKMKYLYRRNMDVFSWWVQHKISISMLKS